MNKEVRFMALGGAQSIGDSCYLLKMGSTSVLLDCGSRMQAGCLQGPDFSPALQSGMLESLAQINDIYISHAHMDHIGYLPFIISEAAGASVYMTQMTQLLANYQFYDKNFRKEYGVSDYMLKETMERRIVPVSFLQRLDRGGYRAVCLQAGHIPGAMMVLLHYGGRNILYTGDYSLSGTPLTDGCVLPEGLKVDVMIMCGTNARRRRQGPQGCGAQVRVDEVFGRLRSAPVNCSFSQLSKSVEVLKAINIYRRRCGVSVPVYLSQAVWRLVSDMEAAGVKLLESGNLLWDGRRPAGRYILLDTPAEARQDYFTEKVRIDFRLHDSFDEMLAFVKNVNPRTAAVVHCAGSTQADSVEQVLMRDPDCRTQFVFPEQGQIYTL